MPVMHRTVLTVARSVLYHAMDGTRGDRTMRCTAKDPRASILWPSVGARQVRSILARRALNLGFHIFPSAGGRAGGGEKSLLSLPPRNQKITSRLPYLYV